MTMTRYVIDGPLISSEGRWSSTGYLRLEPVGQVPVNTRIELTGRVVGQFAEGSSPWELKNGKRRWYYAQLLGGSPVGDSPAGRPSLAGGTATGLSASVRRWAEATEGVRIDVDGKWGAQCVDLSKHWAFENGAPAGAYGDGIDVAKGLSRLPGWTFKAGSATPQPGWIMSLGAPYGVDTDTGAVYGHTAVVIDVLGDRVRVLQQDGFDKDTVAEYGTLPRSAAVGWAVPPTAEGSSSVVVRAGDTLGKIADRAGTDVSTLVRLNGIRDRNVLALGQVIRLP